MDRLHRGHHAQTRQPGDVQRVDELHVLDALAKARRRQLALHRFIDIQHAPVGPIADGVDGAGQPALRRSADGGQQLLRRGDGHAQIIRRAFIGAQHLRCGRAQRPIGEHLDVPDAQPLAAKAGAQAQRQGLRQALQRHHVPHAHAQPPRLLQPGQRAEFVGPLARLHAGEAQRQSGLASGQRGLLAFTVARLGHDALHQRDGRIGQHAGRPAAGVAQNAPPWGIDCVLVNARQPQRRRIAPDCVPIFRAQRHWRGPRDAVEVLPGGHGWHRPHVVVPVAAQHP